MSRYPAGGYRLPTPDETESPHLHPPALLALLEVAAVIWVAVALIFAVSLRLRSVSLEPWETGIVVTFGFLLPIVCAWAIETNKSASRWLVLMWLGGSLVGCWLLLDGRDIAPVYRWGSAAVHLLLLALAAREMLLSPSGRNFYRQLAGLPALATPETRWEPSLRTLQRIGRVSEIVSELALIGVALFIGLYVFYRTLGVPN
ncbi:MAG: hypothetical protein JJU27_04810 [Gammaproteobacteria bacterium]|nr:hypothetical protein [Gammaproteobacteria bacterium]